MFAVQADGHELTTVEGLSTFGSEKNGELHPIQQAFWEKHGLQCGFCTAGILMTVSVYLKENPKPSEHDVRVALSGHLCRCTGYQHIVDAVLLAAEKMQVSTMDLPG
jgi:carbon-monoxide dehydrogenase small subunit